MVHPPGIRVGTCSQIPCVVKSHAVLLIPKSRDRSLNYLRFGLNRFRVLGAGRCVYKHLSCQFQYAKLGDA